MTDIYQACDNALARLLEKVSPNTTILTFAVRGMGPNQGWSDHCAQMVTNIQQGGSGGKAKQGFLYKVKQFLPWSLMRQVTTRLPEGISNRLVEVWSSRMFDWSTTRYFPLPMDHAGYIRINVKGREPQGIVAPGEEYRSVCREVSEAFLTFRDLDTDEPIVKKIIRADELASSDASAFHRLPDLLVTWRKSATDSRGMISEKYGKILFEKNQIPSGRSGNHRDHGWFVASGKGIPQGVTVQGSHIVDLVPTVFEWLGVKAPERFQGKPIPELCAGLRD
jgi:predicted AlkP superfamily phosphohydrolase/phosphomutase